MNVVISQSMLFPWVGMLEQIRLADIFVHYDDVQFSKGSFVNRVQIKTAEGPRWMTVPIKAFKLGQNINEVAIQDNTTWANKHLELLKRSFDGAPYIDDALAIVSDVYGRDYDNLAMLARESMLAVARYYNLLEQTRLIDVVELKVNGSSSQRVLDVVNAVEGDNYITGHGARNYLDHELFDGAKISVKYMDYLKMPYPQLHGEFTPYVSSLDLIANCGPEGISRICSQAMGWNEFLHMPK